MTTNSWTVVWLAAAWASAGPVAPIATAMAQNDNGIHVGYRVADCGVALQAVKDRGGRVIDEQPRPGSRGTTVAFVHPKTSFGTLIELVQE